MKSKQNKQTSNFFDKMHDIQPTYIDRYNKLFFGNYAIDLIIFFDEFLLMKISMNSMNRLNQTNTININVAIISQAPICPFRYFYILMFQIFIQVCNQFSKHEMPYVFNIQHAKISEYFLLGLEFLSQPESIV